MPQKISRDKRGPIQIIAQAEFERRNVTGYNPNKEEDEEDKEVKDLQEKIKAEPNNSEHHYELAKINYYRVYGVDIDYDALSQAIGGFRKAIELSKSSTQEIKYRKALANIYQHDYGDAVAEWDRIIELDPNDIETHDNLARWFEHFGPYHEALKHLKKLNELDFENQDYMRDIADILLREGEHINARSLIKKAIQIYKNKFKEDGRIHDLVDCLEILGYSYSFEKDRRRAKFVFKAGLNLELKHDKFMRNKRIEYGNLSCFTGLLQSLYRLGEFKELEEICDGAISSWKDPGYEVINRGLALAYFFSGIREIDKGNEKKGVEKFRKADNFAFDFLKRVHSDFAATYAWEFGSIRTN